MLSIHKGWFFTLRGPSGCGKTTLLRKIAGLVSTSGGLIRFSVADLTRPPRHRRAIGMVFPDSAVFPDRPVAQIPGAQAGRVNPRAGDQAASAAVRCALVEP